MFLFTIRSCHVFQFRSILFWYFLAQRNNQEFTISATVHCVFVNVLCLTCHCCKCVRVWGERGCLHLHYDNQICMWEKTRHKNPRLSVPQCKVQESKFTDSRNLSILHWNRIYLVKIHSIKSNKGGELILTARYHITWCKEPLSYSREERVKEKCVKSLILLFAAAWNCCKLE